VIHREKVNRLLSELEAKGVSQYTIVPPVFRLFWAIGVEIPPPLFMGFWPLALLLGLMWGTTMYIIMSLIEGRHAVLPFAIGGLLFGLFTAAYFRWKANSSKLPRWKDYGLETA
jgi:Family of unknown function (DUF6404)